MLYTFLYVNIIGDAQEYIPQALNCGGAIELAVVNFSSVKLLASALNKTKISLKCRKVQAWALFLNWA